MLHQLRRYATLGLWAEIVAYHDGHSDTGQEAQAIRALALAAQRNLGAAELQISQLLAQPDLPLNCTADIAATLLILGRLDEAEALLAQVLSADPDHGLANLRLGAWRLTQGQLTQALPHLQIGLAA